MKKFKGNPQGDISVDSDMKRIGRNIKKIRLRSGDSMEIFAEWLGVGTEDTVAKIENGVSSVKATYLFFLAKELKIPIREILLSELELDLEREYQIENIYKAPEIVNDRIKKNIKNARINKLYTEKELAVLLGCCTKTIERLEKPSCKKEKSSYIKVSDIFLIAKTLNIPVENLFAGCE